MPCGKGGKKHGVPTSKRVYSFAPVTLEKANGIDHGSRASLSDQTLAVPELEAVLRIGHARLDARSRFITGEHIGSCRGVSGSLHTVDHACAYAFSCS